MFETWMLAGRRFVILLIMVLALVPSAIPQEGKDKKPKGPLIAQCEREDAVYKLGEKATFHIASTTSGDATYLLSEDGHKAISEGKITFKAGETYSLTGTLKGPGFLQLLIKQGDNKVLAAAAFEPTKIEPTAKMPDDFDAFWEAGKKELAKVDIDAKLDHSERHSSETIDCYKISLANVHGKRVHGWLSVPKGKGPFPAVLTVPGAGVYGIGPDKYHAALGALSMNIIIHDLPVDQKAEYYKEKAAGPLKDYRDIGKTDRDQSYYRDVILGCVRCLDYLTSRPDFNGKDLAVTGGSQGGALTLIVSGLDPRVTLSSPNVAAMCDHSGEAFDRVSGWPHWLKRTPKEDFDKVLKTSAYFDAVNFARKFKGKSLHGVGFIDFVCAPTTVYAAFNVHPEPKIMITSPLMGHSTDPRYLKAREEFWKKNMKLMPPEK